MSSAISGFRGLANSLDRILENLIHKTAIPVTNDNETMANEAMDLLRPIKAYPSPAKIDDTRLWEAMKYYFDELTLLGEALDKNNNSFLRQRIMARRKELFDLSKLYQDEWTRRYHVKNNQSTW